MKYQLIKEINNNYDAIEQILTNRGINYNDIGHYLNTTDDDINEPEAFGLDREMKWSANCLSVAVRDNQDVLVIVDCDCDGFTASALLINYLYELFPAWVTNH